jgi:hypothetical protein
MYGRTRAACDTCGAAQCKQPPASQQYKNASVVFSNIFPAAVFPYWNEGSPQMPRYYFDMREGDEIAPDEEGMELRTLEAMQEEAARSLADMARDAIRRHSPDRAGRRMSIEVRDEAGPVMQVNFTFEVHQHRH